MWCIIELSMSHFNEHSMNLDCETLCPSENIVQWTAICIHWKISEYIISISEITKVNVHKFNMVLILKLLNAPCTCLTFGIHTNHIYVYIIHNMIFWSFFDRQYLTHNMILCMLAIIQFSMKTLCLKSWDTLVN